MENLNSFLNSLGITNEEIRNLKILMDNLLEEISKKDINQEKKNILEEQINNFIFSKIIMPYCLFDKDKAKLMMEKFCLNTQQINNDLCQIHNNSNELELGNKNI